MKILNWKDCYTVPAKGLILDEAMIHPAKMSVALCRRILRFMEEQKMLKKGDTIVDPFGGIGMTGIIGTIEDYKVISVELEEKFVALARRNFAHYEATFTYLHRTQPVILQGDSRQLRKIISGASDAVLTSPPYADQQQIQGSAAIGWKYVKLASEGKMDEAVRLYRKEVIERLPKHGRWTDDNIRKHIEKASAKGYDSVLTSPPYSSIAAGAGGLNTKPANKPGQQSGRASDSASQQANQRYGEQSGQIARLKDKGIDGVLTSPPFNENKSNVIHGQTKGFHSHDKNESKNRMKRDYAQASDHASIGRLEVGGILTSPPWEKNTEGSRKASKFKGTKAILDANRGHGASDAAVLRQAAQAEHSVIPKSPGQIAKESGETYWAAMKTVYSECYEILKGNGWAAIVVKDFVRKGQIIPLCDNTVKLLEHVGFKVHYRARAHLVQDMGVPDFFHGKTKTKQRKSFFRRLHEAKSPHTAINWEEVIFAQKGKQ